MLSCSSTLLFVEDEYQLYRINSCIAKSRSQDYKFDQPECNLLFTLMLLFIGYYLSKFQSLLRIGFNCRDCWSWFMLRGVGPSSTRWTCMVIIAPIREHGVASSLRQNLKQKQRRASQIFLPTELPAANFLIDF